MKWFTILCVLVMWGCSPVERPLDNLPCTPDGECVDGWVCYEKTNLCIPEGSLCNPDPCDHGVCSADGKCTCDDGWSGDTCDVPDDPCDPDPCAGEHRVCVDDNGSASCGDCLAGYHPEGDDCVADIDCQPNTCSAHGDCDDASGAPVCTCDLEYSGDHCDVCADGFHWNADGTACTSDLCDPNPCNELHKSVCTADGDQAVCSCDNGYHDDGGDCVADTDCQPNTCSGHGVCDDTSGSPVCTCDAGYTGDICDACDNGYQDNDGDTVCEPDCATSGLDCGDHGDCDDGNGQAVCTCDTGYTGAACNICDIGYQDNDDDTVCEPTCETSGLDCGGHGDCADGSGSAECDCDTGYAGQLCGQCDTGYQDNDSNGSCLLDCSSLDCGDHGSCDDSVGHAVCVCDVWWGGIGCVINLVGQVLFDVGYNPLVNNMPNSVIRHQVTSNVDASVDRHEFTLEFQDALGDPMPGIAIQEVWYYRGLGELLTDQEVSFDFDDTHVTVNFLTPELLTGGVPQDYSLLIRVSGTSPGDKVMTTFEGVGQGEEFFAFEGVSVTTP